MPRFALAIVIAACAGCTGTDAVFSVVHDPPPPTPPGQAILTISELRHDFGEVDVGAEQTAALRITNSGTAASAALDPKLTGDVSSFAIGGDCAGRTLDAGASCSVATSFRPRVDGTHSATLAIGDVSAVLEGSGRRLVVIIVDATSFAEGSGSVSVEPSSTCKVPCRLSVSVRLGSTVSVNAVSDPESQFRWTGRCRLISMARGGGAGQCSFVASADEVVPVVFNGANYVFVTSERYPVTLGRAGYDAACVSLAAAAGFSGPFVAFVSTSGMPAPARLGDARGFIRPDGLPVADRLDGVAPLDFPPALDEHGRLVTGANFEQAVFPDPALRWVMTGTEWNGELGGTCSDWSATSTTQPLTLGDPWDGAGGWVGSLGAWCAGEWPVYCVGTALHRALSPPRASGRIAFVSHLARLTTGIGDADRLCASEAATAGVGGSFRALLASPGAAAISRFDLSGPPWVRIDGIPVVRTAADLAAGALLAAIDLHADGTVVADWNATWSGARSPAEPGSQTSTCGGWTQDAAGQGIVGANMSTDPAEWFGFGNEPCGAAALVYCLQE